MFLACMLHSCSNTKVSNGGTSVDKDSLLVALHEVVDEQPGQFGIAVIIDNNDTIVLNNSSDYPMMSMFKLHEALAVCHRLDMKSADLDTVLELRRSELDAETWSPMLKEHVGESFRLTAGELIDYILVCSDNNASNFLFDQIISAPETDACIHEMLPGSDFAIKHREADMKAEIGKSYENRTSPLAYAMLVNRLFTDSLVSVSKQEHVKRGMRNCDTGMPRIAAGLPDVPDIVFSHRTGSGYVNDHGEVIAVNDGGYVELPSGKKYTVVVFVRDFGGEQEEAEQIISRISSAVYEYVDNSF